jgi:hypothetical protein
MSGRGVHLPLAAGLPPGSILALAAQPPALPLLEQMGQHPSQLRDHRFLHALATMVELMVGQSVNSKQQLPL